MHVHVHVHASQVRELARAYNTDPNHPLALHLFIDVHAHSVCMNCFVFANAPESDDPRSLESVAAFPRLASGLGLGLGLVRVRVRVRVRVSVAAPRLG